MDIRISILTNLSEIIENSYSPYEILGVSRNSSPFEIKNAYKRLTRQFHPDKSLLDIHKSNRVFAKINEAYKKVNNYEYEFEDINKQEMTNKAKEGLWGSILDSLLNRVSNRCGFKLFMCKILFYVTILMIATAFIRGLFIGMDNNKGYFRFQMHPKFNLRANTPCNDYAVFVERDFYKLYDVSTQKNIMHNAEVAKVSEFKRRCEEHNRKIEILKARLDIAGTHERIVIRDEIGALSNQKICLEFELGTEKLKNCNKLN